MVRNVGSKLALLFNMFVNIPLFRSSERKPLPVAVKVRHERAINIIWWLVTLSFVVGASIFLLYYVTQNISFPEIRHVFFLGMITAFRVFILIILSTLFWVPVGIWIGLRPRVAQIAQPVAQILAAFPANLLYPFIVVFIVSYHLSPNIWLTPLMILGSQWYILFNVVAGASTLPKDLLQVVDNLGVVGWLRWSRLLLPGVFPYYVTGAITAAGGAWNASIVAEVASWGNETVVATGLGAYITEYTTAGSFPRIALGIGMMCIIVLVFNRLIWRPLYSFAVERFLLE
jgi:NitT/TauT family transport system permease protein